MLLLHIRIASKRQFQCAHTTYDRSINERFHHKTDFQKLLNYFFMFLCNEHVEINKFLCSLACTWITIIDSQFYIIDSLTLDVSLE